MRTDLIPHHRARNAEATRNAILDAARERFVREGYDDVGVRDIARDARADPALISRYFGSKEDLFATVLESCGDARELIQGNRSDFGSRLANELLFEPQHLGKLQVIQIMLRSVGSTKASEIILRSARTNFFRPLADWIGGPEAEMRAQMTAALLMGMSVNRTLRGGTAPWGADVHVLRDRLAKTLQDLID